MLKYCLTKNSFIMETKTKQSGTKKNGSKTESIQSGGQGPIDQGGWDGSNLLWLISLV